MNLRQLRTLATILEHGSFAAAGDRIGLSHAAISVQMNQLEASLAARLFDRSSRPVALTADGLRIAQLAGEILDKVEALRLEASGAKTSGSVSIGFIPTCVQHLLPRVLQAMREGFPDLQVNVISALSGELAAAVVRRELDYALITTPIIEIPELDITPIASEPFHVIGPAGALAATATDMLKFGSALLNGGVFEGRRILQAETLEEMNKTQFTYDDRVKGIGLGFLHYPWGDTGTFGHDGGTTAFFSHFGITPSAGLVIFSSFSGPGGAKTYSTLSREIYSEFFARPDHHDTPPTDFDNRASEFAGTYISWRASFSKLEKLMGLASQVKVAPNGEGELMIGEDRFVEIGNRLFRNVENGDVVAFQENDQGEIIGYVQNGWSILSMYKARTHTSQAFNFALLGLSVIVFLAVFLRYLYQRDRFRTLPAADKTATRAAVIAAASHLWVLIFGGIVAVAVGDQLMARIPLLFKFWLIFPIIATLATFYLLYQTVLVWKNGLLSGNFVRIRYSVVSLCALFMAWFYYFWNILGFRYY